MQKIIATMQALRKNTPPSFDINIAKGSEIWPYFKNQNPKQRVIIFLRSSGCAWVKRSGGCTMCQHAWEGTTQGIKIPPESYINQFNTEFDKYSFGEDITGICVFNEGNFFNEGELPCEARRYIIKKILENPFIKDVTFETLPEFMNQEAYNDILLLTQAGKLVTIGIGLESSSIDIRKLINKPFSLFKYEEAVKKIHEVNAKVLAYIVVKPAFLTESESLEDSWRTAHYAFNVGTDIVSFEPINIGKFTINGILHKKGLYRAPWWYTTFCAAIQSRIDKNKEIRIGGAQYQPHYNLVPHNCDLCSERVARSIDNWNKTQDVKYLSDVLYNNPCLCIEGWRKDMQLIDELPFLERPDRDL